MERVEKRERVELDSGEERESPVISSSRDEHGREIFECVVTGRGGGLLSVRIG